MTLCASFVKHFMKSEMLELAKEAWGENHEVFWFDDDGIERFAALVAAHEREACAQVCEAKQSYNAMHANTEFAAAIRARGEK